MAVHDIRVKQIAEFLGVPYLIHFTNAKNLPQIVKFGLVPRANHASQGIVSLTNDELRLDNRLDGTSVSISFPNDRVFYRFRMAAPDTDWVVLMIGRNVLWEKRCIFCPTNAASSTVANREVTEMMSSIAFVSLFDDTTPPTRRANGLLPHDPTNVQSEVLVLDSIPPSSIKGAVFSNDSARQTYASILGDRETLVHGPNKGFFGARSVARGR